MNRIETGRPMTQGSFRATGTIAYSAEIPEVMQVTDSSFESNSNFIGDEITIITSSNAYCYESRIMVSGEGLYAFTDLISAGVSLDASLGSIAGAPIIVGRSLLDDLFEGAVITRFAKQFGDLAVSIKPELVLVHLYGNRTSAEIQNNASEKTATERLSYYTLSIRSSSIIRYDISNSLSPFLGAQIKSQQYLLANNNIDHELAYGIYTGIDFSNNFAAISPYVAIPLGSAVSHFRSPVSIGVQASLMLTQRNKDQD